MTSIDFNTFKINISQLQVTINGMISFVLKELCPDKVPVKNTYIVKIQGIEMNNITTVEKIKIEEGVWQYTVNLCPIMPTLIPSVPCDKLLNVIEVDGTSNMSVAGTGLYDGFYTLTCIGDLISVYSKNGINLIDDCNPELTGFYCKVVSSSKVSYDKIESGNKYTIFYYTPTRKWYIKQVLKNKVKVNNIMYEQEEKGYPEEVPMVGWKAYISTVTCKQSCGSCNPKKLSLHPCIPFRDNISNLILVNCGGYDDANGCYYKDTINRRFVNVRNSKLSIVYDVDQKIGLASWIIVDSSITPPSYIYTSPIIKPSGSGFNYSNLCIPCCGWEKICQTPGDPPQVTALDYYNVINPKFTMSYSTSNDGGWGLFNGFVEVGHGTSDHHIVVRTNLTSLDVDGAYCLTCVTPNNPPAYTKILNTAISFAYNVSNSKWEIKNGTTVLYNNPSTNPVVPPFDGWVKVGSVNGSLPLVLNTILPSSVNWTLL